MTLGYMMLAMSHSSRSTNWRNNYICRRLERSVCFLGVLVAWSTLASVCNIRSGLGSHNIQLLYGLGSVYSAHEHPNLLQGGSTLRHHISKCGDDLSNFLSF